MDSQGEPKILIKPKTHSRLGVASFILSVLASLLLSAGLLLMGLLITHPGTAKQKATQETLSHLLNMDMIMTVLMSAPLLLLSALILGIAGLRERHHKKAFALAGTLISGLFILLPFIGFLYFVFERNRL